MVLITGRYEGQAVRKLYPDAQLPSFECTSEPGRLAMLYRSTRPFADLAEGLIMGCIEHLGECIDVQREDLFSWPGTCVRLLLIKRS